MLLVIKVKNIEASFIFLARLLYIWDKPEYCTRCEISKQALYISLVYCIFALDNQLFRI